MDHDISIRMTGHAARMPNAHAAKHDVVAVGEGMHVETDAGSHVGQRRKLQYFGAHEVLVGRYFDVARFAFKHADVMPGPFGKRGIIGETLKAGCGGAPMRVQYGVE